MGLDSYLKATKYISGWPPHVRIPTDAHQSAMHGAVLHALGISRSSLPYEAPSVEVTLTVAYWRKANAIHSWFVDHVQGGLDECQEAHVTREHLQELTALCQKVLSRPELAPGKFESKEEHYFGVDDYTNPGFIRDLQDTVRQLDAVLTNPELTGWDFSYCSSW